jgi:hypothetical protein
MPNGIVTMPLSSRMEAGPGTPWQVPESVQLHGAARGSQNRELTTTPPLASYA